MIKTIAPILITGSHRSGSTWVGNMIATCSSVAYIHEPFNGVCRPGICQAKFPYTFMYINEENENNFYGPLKRTLSFQYNLKAEAQVIKQPIDIARLVKDYLSFQKNIILQKRPLLKDPMAIFSAGWLARKFKMKVLVLIRHPAAFVSSCKELNWGYDFSHIINQPLLIRDYLYPFEKEIIKFIDYEHDIIEKCAFLWKLIYYMVTQYQKIHQEWLFVRYEDICDNPLQLYSNLFQYLDLSFTDKTKIMIEEHSNYLHYKGIFDEIHSIKRLSSKNIDVWKNRLTSSEIKKIREQVEDISKHFYSEQDW